MPEQITLSARARKYVRILTAGHMTEGEIIAFRSFLRNADNKPYFPAIWAAWGKKEITISDDHMQKGYDFLMNKWKMSSGRERRNNPFNKEQQSILENFSHFTLYDIRQEFHWLPIWSCKATDGISFEYYYDFKKIHFLNKHK